MASPTPGWLTGVDKGAVSWERVALSADMNLRHGRRGVSGRTRQTPLQMWGGSGRGLVSEMESELEI